MGILAVHAQSMSHVFLDKGGLGWNRVSRPDSAPLAGSLIAIVITPLLARRMKNVSWKTTLLPCATHRLGRFMGRSNAELPFRQAGVH